MPVTIRRAGPDDLESWIAAAHAGFLNPGEVATEAQFRRPFFEFDRTRGAFEGSRCVATFRSFATELTLPGGSAPAVCAITGVTVSPTHRRRGLLTRLMTDELRDTADRGEPAAVLIASEWPIYGRFGFGPATEAATYELDELRGRFTTRRTMEAELVEPEQLAALAPAVFDRFRLGRAGSIDRQRPKWWEIHLGVVDAPNFHREKGFAAVVRDGRGEVQGYIRYHANESWDDRVCNTVLAIDELTAATDEATRALWRYATEVDLVRTVRAEQRPVDEWIGHELTDGRAFRQVARADLLWLRPIDVPRLLEARRYPTSDRLVLEIADDARYAAGRFELDASPDGATCRTTSDEPDIRLPAAVLGSLYLGGHAATALRRAGLLEASPEAARRAAVLFASDPAPWCNTWF